ncbi:MAG: hypothetical protein EU550_01990, partial [Promethearchaeota archaeon]
MSPLEKRLYRIYLNVKPYSILLEIIVTFIALTVIFNHLIGIGDIISNSSLYFFSGISESLLFFSMIFTILFLPCFPIFFWFPKHFNFIKNYGLFEKFAFTIILNLCIYILMGYFSGMIGIPITGFFFFLNVISLFLLQVIAYLIISVKRKVSIIDKNEDVLREKEDLITQFSLLGYLKAKFKPNLILLIVFIFLICLFDVVRVKDFVGTDPWYHITIIKIISIANYIPYDAYLGAMGLHIFSSVIYFFSGVEIVLIPKFFVFYTFPISALIVYVIFKQVFKNRNLVILGVFLLEFTSLGFSIMMYQFWPSSISFLMGMVLFYLLFVRLKDFIKKHKEKTLSYFPRGSEFDYVFMVILFLTSIFTHSLITVILLISYLFILLVFFVKNHKIGQDFIIFSGLTILFVIFNLLGIGSGHFNIFGELTATPWPYILAGALGGGVILLLIVWMLKKSVTLHYGSFDSVIRGEKLGYYKKFEEKFFFPFTIIVSIISITLFIIINFFYWNFRLVTILTSLETTIILIFSVWGLVLFQKTPKGKIFFIWAAGLALLFGVGFLFDLLIGVLKLWSRIFYLSSPVLVIGFLSYFYKIIRTHQIRDLNKKLFLIFFIGFSLIATYVEEANSINVFEVSDRDLSTIYWYSNYTESKNVIISEFGWNTALIYYDFPYEQCNKSLNPNYIHYYFAMNKTFSNPGLHF